MDAGDLYTHPHLAKAWSRCGQPVMVTEAGKDQWRVVFGAVDYASERVVWHLAARKGGEGFAAFVARIAQTWPDQLLMMALDNVTYHRTSAVHTW